VIEIIQEYGFPVVAVIGMGWFIWFIYNYITEEIDGKLAEANTVLIALIDRIRMLDNDIIRLKSKVNTVIELKENAEKRDDKKEENAK
jgi:hypothetical protein|tara:strand:+ start:661 stop:924 length:264 start_codon:yes stop_codon:yes gene_type:complete